MRRSKILIFLMCVLSIVLVGCTDVNNNVNNNNNNNNNSNPILKDLTIQIDVEKESYYLGDNIIVDIDVSNKNLVNNVDLEIKTNDFDALVFENVIIPNEAGEVSIIARIEDVISNELTIKVLDNIYNTDPYTNMLYSDFYKNYEESINPKDSYYRSLHGFMSGDIELPNEAPIVPDYQPMEDGLYIRNTNAYYSNNNETYFITDGYGEIVNVIFKNAGYISLDEVASHLLAFGSTPGNYISKKSGNPSTSIWKEYLRLNNSSFSGDTSRYPYEPILPRISGCGGDLYYYEIDFGTTGTTCDPNYDIAPYNNGSKITRGAARLVYTRYDKNKNDIIDINERYVFYTYNHYNDFQEYLNYKNGFGEMFGNITGGGTLSSKTDYNPTQYVEVARKDITLEIDLKNYKTEIPVVILKKDDFIRKV